MTKTIRVDIPETHTEFATRYNRDPVFHEAVNQYRRDNGHDTIAHVWEQRRGLGIFVRSELLYGQEHTAPPGQYIPLPFGRGFEPAFRSIMGNDRFERNQDDDEPTPVDGHQRRSQTRDSNGEITDTGDESLRPVARWVDSPVSPYAGDADTDAVMQAVADAVDNTTEERVDTLRTMKSNGHLTQAGFESELERVIDDRDVAITVAAVEAHETGLLNTREFDAIVDEHAPIDREPVAFSTDGTDDAPDVRHPETNNTTDLVDRWVLLAILSALILFIATVFIIVM